MIGLLTALCLIVWAYIIAKRSPAIYAEKLAAFTVCGFFFLYTIVSAGFFWVDCFSFEGTLTVCLLLEAVLAAAYTVRGMKMTGVSGVKALLPQITFFDPRYRLLLLIVLAALPFTWNKFELYSMGQDQGTYQVKALALMEYDTHNYMEMTEFTKLETPEERQKYLDFIYGQNNLYLPRVIEETKTDASEFTHIIGTIHGLPTYSALLALWGKLFGYENMIGVQTVLYLALILLAYFVAENAGLKRATAALVALLTAFSPIVVWGSKASLTEVGLALIFAAFLYALTSGERNAALAGIPLAVFAAFHISIYVFVPILVIVLLVMYVVEREQGWIFSLWTTLAAYLLSAFWSFDIAPYYSYGNYSVLWKLTRNLIHEKNIKAVIIALCVGLTVLSFFCMTQKGTDLLTKLEQKVTGGRCFWNVAAWMLRLSLIISLIFFIYKGVIKAEYVRYCQYLQISTYLYMSGLILIPLIYICLLWKPKKLLADKQTAVWILLFLYCVIAYSAFMRLEVLFYYYYARYVTIFLLVVFVLAGRLLETFDPKGKGTWIVMILALVTFVPYDAGLLTQKDHSRCEWEVLGDICEDITQEDAFIVGPDEQQIVFIFPVKLLTGCDVYYADEDLYTQMKKLAKDYKSIYYLDYHEALEEKMAADSQWQDGGLSVQEVYNNWNHLSYLDYFNITNPLTPIPLNYVEYRLKLSMHEIRAD